MKRQRLNKKRYNTLKSDLDPVFEKKIASREARLSGKKDIIKQLKEVDNG